MRSRSRKVPGFFYGNVRNRKVQVMFRDGKITEKQIKLKHPKNVYQTKQEVTVMKKKYAAILLSAFSAVTGEKKIRPTTV